LQASMPRDRMKGAVKIRPGLSLKHVGLGVALAFTLAFVLAGIVGQVIYQGWISEALSPLLMSLISFTSLFAGGVYAGRRARFAGWAHGGLAGLVYMVAVAGIGLAVFDQLAPPVVLLERVGIGLTLGAVAGTLGINLR
jgi:putative membrane protein (TIGR04086 family)